MYLRKSRTALHNAADGFVLKPPPAQEFLEAFRRVCADFDLDQQLKLPIPQQLRENRWVDTEDRIQAGARLLRSLVSAGLLKSLCSNAGLIPAGCHVPARYSNANGMSNRTGRPTF